jgi:hypothetical protein
MGHGLQTGSPDRTQIHRRVLLLVQFRNQHSVVQTDMHTYGSDITSTSHSIAMHNNIAAFS